MSVLERLYRLEIEFHRLFRLQASAMSEPWSVHTSYALQCGYEPMLRTIGVVDADTLARAKARMIGQSDPRDVEAADYSLRHLMMG